MHIIAGNNKIKYDTIDGSVVHVEGFYHWDLPISCVRKIPQHVVEKIMELQK